MLSQGRNTETVYELLEYISKVKNINKKEASEYLVSCDFKCKEINDFQKLNLNN